MSILVSIEMVVPYSVVAMIVLFLVMAFVATFALTWWIRGRGFGELLELLGRKPKGPRP